MAQSFMYGKWLGLALGVIGSLGHGGAAMAEGLGVTGCSLNVAEENVALVSPESVCPPDAAVLAQTQTPSPTPESASDESSLHSTSHVDPDSTEPLTEEELAPLELDPRVIQESPVLRQWLNEVPDIAEEIRHTPSFRTRLRVGYANFPSNGEIGGFQLGVDDVFVWPGTGLTASADYSRSGNGQRESYGAEARYYLLPLGGYVNVAPSVGYRSVSAPAYSTDGLDLGLRLMLIPSRGGGADLAISQHWVAPGTDREVGITSFALGYAVTGQLRLGSDLQFQNSRFGQESRWGLSLEWLL
ncbi:hypothetical protein GFS31_27250 [Leptolyngbya sp. BL0902]|uniref:hypothetical protein n=1 Tax=Leptolyngbya sp. BL0902 TaxID=1115757 RepID=UPI001936ED9D|nr:hypothetical protein [Leptolyngbya sp. BL0902]QQE66030.1 hypothetical protein GFS31_27250 [Leptolyngbya sp. BL0902]